MAAPTTVITTVKAFTYRNIADSTAWRALFDAINVEERKVYTPSTQVIRAYGYNKVPVKGDHAIWSVDLRPSSSTVAGSLSSGIGAQMAGDQAAWVRWSLDRYNSFGKRVYLRKYFHSGMIAGAGGDALLTAYITALGAFGTFMMGGTLLGSRKVCDQLGNVPVATAASQYVTTRTLKRRSKRDPSP